jgi:hypothetical protein
MFSYEKLFDDNINDSIIYNDYELVFPMFEDDIKEIIHSSEELKFIIKFNYSINLESDTTQTIQQMKFPCLSITNNELLIPYWIQFEYNSSLKKLIYKFFILWIQDNIQLIDEIKNELNAIEEPYIYNAIDLIQSKLEHSLNDSNVVFFLNQIKLQNLSNMSLENALFTISKANLDLNGFLYEEKMEKNEKNEKILKKSEKNEGGEDKNLQKKEKPKLSEYDLFFEKGGVKSEILTEKDYAFQCHGIVVTKKEEINLYKSYLLSNNKIKKATRNVIAFRMMDKEKNCIIDDYDDDGEHYAGTRILGYLQKIKIYNILILVTRFNGDLHLKQHSTKYLTIVENFMKDYKNLFQFEK